jgi:spore maturation protein CgeB
MGKRCEKLLPAFETKILDRISGAQRDVSLSFVGDLSPAHSHRLRAVKRLVRETPLQLWGTCMQPPPITGLRSLGRRLWHRVFVDDTFLRQRFQGEAWGMDLYNILGRSAMTFNSHIDVAAAQAGNMRMFEAPGCGTALLTEAFSNLSSLFEPGTEVVAYDNEDDLVQKAKYYLEHEKEAATIGVRGQQRVVKDHNTVARAAEFLTICESHLRGTV